MALSLGGNETLHKSPLNVGKTRSAAVKPDALTQVGAPGATFPAGKTGARRVHRHPLSGLKRGDAAARRDYLAGYLMAQNQRFAQSKIAGTSIVEVMQVRPADPACAQRN
jgi:hypothetical protein